MTFVMFGELLKKTNPFRVLNSERVAIKDFKDF